jgi:hypothetical protein
LDYLFGALILLVGRHNGFAAQIWTDIKSALGALVFAADPGLGQVIDKHSYLKGLPRNPTVPAFVTSARILSSGDDEDNGVR